MQPEPLDAAIETPIEDAAEQTQDVNPVEVDEDVDVDYPADVRRGMEVDEWDATEQARTVEFSDDYR
jgi:flavin-binding protein dodecin